MDIVATITDYRMSITTFILFGVLHSFCAQEAFKNRLADWVGMFFVTYFWRLIYCVVSYVTLYHLVSLFHWEQHPNANVWLINYPDWLWRSIVVLHLSSIALIYTAFLQSDYLEFWGVKQAWLGVRALRGRSPAGAEIALFGTHRLVVDGLYGWIRHPMLIGGFLFLMTSGPSKNNIIFLCMYTLYMVLGAYYEERRLIRNFGDEYHSYRQQVGAFIPKAIPRLSQRNQ